MPVITPPAPGQQEEESKNWYRSEALRKVVNDLTALRDEFPDGPARSLVSDALTSLGAARIKLDPRLKPVAPRVKPLR